MFTLLTFVLFMTATNSATVSVDYTISMENPSAHYFTVQMKIANSPDDSTLLKMPVWTPGSYLVREYAKNIDRVTTTDENGNALPVRKVSKNSWSVANQKKNFTVQYAVYAFEESVRTCFLDDQHAYIAPAGLFIYPADHDVPLTIHFHPQKNWKQISTALEKVNNDPWTRIAPNRDILFDSPIEIGNQTIFHFTAAGVDHEVSMYGAGNYDSVKIKNDFPKIVEEEAKIFGEHPAPHYTILVQNSTAGGGGLEHANSMSLLAKRFNYQPDAGYTQFLGLFSHEYFHLWNVKRLRPFALGPFNYDEENYTTSLWIVEGFTSYYDDLILRRAGLMTTQSYLGVAESNLNSVDNAPGDKIQSVAEASLDAWIKYYRQNENSNNSQVNYYSKGAVLAMLLDLEIIHQSNGKYSLDDVMKFMYDEYYKKLDRGYTEEEMKAALEKFAGEDLSPFYANYVFGTEKADYAKYFAYVGMTVTNINTNILESDLGMSISDKGTISGIRKNSAGEKGGLNVNDEILAISGFRFANNLSTFLLNKKPGDTIEIMVNRNGVIRSFTVTLQNTDKVSYKLSLTSDATDAQKELYKKWLHAEGFN